MGLPHELWNKQYLADAIADALAKKVLKVQAHGHELWYPYTIEVKEPTPYVEWDYYVCTPFELNILNDLGAPASEVDVIETSSNFTIAWGPNRPVDSDGNPLWFPKTITAGSKFKLEDKRIETLYIHALDKGEILINVQGSADC